MAALTNPARIQPAELKLGVAAVLRPNGRPAGTAFLVAPTTLLTCAHVIEAVGQAPGGTVRLSFEAEPGTEYSAAIYPAANWSPTEEFDAAVLDLNGPPPDRAIVLPLAESRLSANRAFHLFGYPQDPALADFQGHPAPGDLLDTARRKDGRSFLVLRGQEVIGGHSGSPVLDVTLGQVVGMLRARLPGLDPDHELAELRYAVRSEDLQQVYPSLVVQSLAGQPPPPGGLTLSEADNEALVAALKKYLLSGLPVQPPLRLAMSLLGQVGWPKEWKERRLGALMGDVDGDARGLINYALEQGSLENNPQLTALGALLMPLLRHLGAQDKARVQQIITEHRLIQA
jgi:hypothetical protein